MRREHDQRRLRIRGPPVNPYQHIDHLNGSSIPSACEEFLIRAVASKFRKSIAQSFERRSMASGRNRTRSSIADESLQLLDRAVTVERTEITRFLRNRCGKMTKCGECDDDRCAKTHRDARSSACRARIDHARA